MALTVNTNISALNAQRSTLDSQNEMASAMERLASGKRINSARDDAAGLAIAARMENQISGLNQAVRNANDAISLVQTAEGALQETTNILQRIRELAIQSAGGAPSNADRVNLNKEVVQLQEELSRIANTTRFNGGLLLNGTFIDTDFQIGQSNNEEITVSIGDVRPERIGAYTQQTVNNVGLINKGSGLDQIDNGVNQQTLIVGVGKEVPRTVAIKQGDDARTISDKINQAGAMVNSTARTESDVYIGGHGTFSFKISSSATPDIQDVITVGATAGSQAATLAAEINSAYSEHNISATIEVDDNGVEYVKMVQDDGYDIMVEDYVTTGDSTIDFGGDGVYEMTGAFGETAAIIGGRITIDAPESFLISSDDPSNTILQGTRASLEVVGVNNDPSAYQNASFDVAVNGVTKTINLAAPPPLEPTGATTPVLEMNFVATSQTQGPSGQQIGAIRPTAYSITTIDTSVEPARGSADLQFSLSVNNGDPVNLDLADALAELEYESGDSVTPDDFEVALRETIQNNPYFDSGDELVTVTLTDNGQIQLDVAGGVGEITFAESTTRSAAYAESFGAVDNDSYEITITDHGFTTGDEVDYFSTGQNDTGGLVDNDSYFVIVVDENTIQLAASSANALADTPVPIEVDGDGVGETITRAVSNGLAAFLIKDTPPTEESLIGKSTESAESGTGSLTLGQTINDAADNAYGPVKPLGISNRVITAGLNDTFTLAINDGAPTVIEVTAGTYYSMEHLANAVQDAIDNSPFSAEGDFPITVAADTDDNGDWGLVFASEDGYSIQLGGTSFLTNSNALNVDGPSTSPDIDVANSWSISDVDNDSITITNHGYSTGDAVQYLAADNDAGLVSGTTYYVINVDANTIQLASNDSNALAGTELSLTGDGFGHQISDGSGERKLTISAGPIDEAATQLAINVNNGGFADIDLKQYLTDAGVSSTATTVTEDQFVEALQEALNESVYFQGDEAIEVSVTDQGLVQLTVAGGIGTIVVAEHSAYRGSSNGLVETLTGTVANASALSNGLSTGEAAQSGTGGSIILGSVANAANNDPQDADYVKPFGISPITVTADTGDQLYVSIDGGNPTRLTIPSDDYFNMQHLARAVQEQITNSTQIGATAAVTVNVTATQNSTDSSWGLSFASTDGSQVDLYGNFFGQTLGIQVGSDESTQLGQASDSWVIGGGIDNDTNYITLDNHGLTTGSTLVYDDGSDNDAALVDGTTYYAIVIDENTIQLATNDSEATAGNAIDLIGGGSATQSLAFTGAPITIAAIGVAPVGEAGSRTSVEAGAFSNGIDLTDNAVTVEVVDRVTGAIHSKTVSLGSTDSSVSFDDYMSYLEAAANENFIDEGFTFTVGGSGSGYTMSFEPAGGYDVTVSGTSIVEAFGGPVTASGEASNLDGQTFESMDDVVTELNAQLAANGIEMTAVFNRGGDTFRFAVTGGPADSTSMISLSGDDLVDLGFTGSLDAIGGGTHKAEDVRYVSQIDISTREGASLSMTVVDAALETLASIRGGLGAVANRLESTISNLMNISENTSASMSRVMDADFAAESTRLARAQVLQQASVAMLAQANASAQNVLKLLQ